MATKTKIQWCDSTINPVMGCGGCELFPAAGAILSKLDRVLGAIAYWPAGSSKRIYEEFIATEYAAIKNPQPGHSAALTTTNLWHLRGEFCQEVFMQLGAKASRAADRAIAGAVTCYAAKLHLNKARAISNPSRGSNSGYAPAFEMVTPFSGRVWRMARMPDLLGVRRPEKPWLGRLRRHIFVSDMGDAFSRESDFKFLKTEVIEPIRSAEGQRHFWLWLTKRPRRMALFGELIGGFPSNVWAMTTVTGPETLARVDELRAVRASLRGLSIEPLWDRIPPERLNLEGIDWVILGGESGRRDCVRSFDVQWARELRDYCYAHGVAFFLKQLGRRPVENGKELHLHDSHGGDWEEWPEDLRVREMPIKETGDKRESQTSKPLHKRSFAEVLPTKTPRELDSQLEDRI